MSSKLPPHWRSRLILYKRIQDREKYEAIGQEAYFAEDGIVDYDLEFAPGRTPRGFRRYVGSFLVDGGYIHSEVVKRMQQKGLGTQAYRTILHDLGQLSSFVHSASWEAQKIWRKLAKIYRHDKDFWSSEITVYADSVSFDGFKIENIIND